METSYVLKVQVWIYCQCQAGKWLFLILRTLPHRKSFWQPVTGSVEKNESLVNAALREANEETGMIFAGVPNPLGSPFTFESRGFQVKESGFSLQAPILGPCPPLVRLDAHEHCEYRWVTSEEAFKMIAYSSNAQMLHCLLKNLR